MVNLQESVKYVNDLKFFFLPWTLCNFMKPTKSLYQVELCCCLCKSQLFKTMKEVQWYCCAKLNLAIQEIMIIEMKEINNIIYINVANHIQQNTSHGYTIDIQNEGNDLLQLQLGILYGNSIWRFNLRIQFW